MKIKLITMGHMEGVEIDTKQLLAVRFEFSEEPENWIDVNVTHDGIGIALYSYPLMQIVPVAGNAVAIYPKSYE